MASEIAGDIKPISLKLQFEWEINYFRVKSQKVEEYLESPKFTANCGDSNIRWRMRLLREKVQPRHTEEFLIFNLYYDHPYSKLFPDFTLIDTAGEHIYKLHTCKVRDCSYHDILTILEKNVQYIPRAYVENPKNAILLNTTLKFLFELNINEEMKCNGDDILLPLEAINKYEALLTDSKFSDVSLISEGKTMNVHKCILAQSSPVFAAMFDAEMKEKQDAKVIECLQLADKLRMDKLRQKVIEFIVEHASDVADKPEFDLLPNDIVRDLCYRLAKKK